jgi:hypothetical protein
VLVHEVLIALVRDAERLAQQLGGDAKEPAAAPKEHFHGGVAEDLLLASDGLYALVDHGGEGFAVRPGLHVYARGDAHRERRVLLHLEVAAELREPDQPHGEDVAAVEGEVEEAGQIDEESISEVLGLVDDDDRRGVSLVDHVEERLLDVGPQLGAPMRRADAELDRQ